MTDLNPQPSDGGHCLCSHVAHSVLAGTAAFETFRTKTGQERSKLLWKWYDPMMENGDDIVTLIT